MKLETIDGLQFTPSCSVVRMSSFLVRVEGMSLKTPHASPSAVISDKLLGLSGSCDRIKHTSSWQRCSCVNVLVADYCHTS